MTLRSSWDSPPVMRVRLSLRLLTERRAALFISIDALFLFAGMMIGLAGTGSARDFWLPFFLMPLLVVGVEAVFFDEGGCRHESPVGWGFIVIEPVTLNQLNYRAKS